MLSFCCTKINVGLEVIEKRPDGFHNLKSFFFPLPFGDILEMELSEKNDLKCYGISVNVAKKENLVWKAWIYLQEKYKLPNVCWHLYKIVPPGTGIGAGSGDLAEVLHMANRFFSLGLSIPVLEEIALLFGSDTGFFVKKVPALMEGRGEIMTEIPFFLKGKFLILIKPENIHMSTKVAFSKIRLENKKTSMNFEKGSEIESINELSNDFEKGFIKDFPEVSPLQTQLKNAGAFYQSMSGSGSCFYGIFDKEPEEAKLKGLPIIWKGVLAPISVL